MNRRDLKDVHAVRDIRRGEHTVVKHGSPGRVLSSHPSWFETTYTVNFTGIGNKHRGAITLIGLNSDDVQAGKSTSAASIPGQSGPCSPRRPSNLTPVR